MRTAKALMAAPLALLLACDSDVTYEVQGAVEKGPFIEGTEITVRELDGNLEPTGRTFSAVVEDDTGFFTVEASLASPYVELSASGFYFNEVAGELSSAPITLRAISDLTDQSTVNVNLLTHLEKSRVEDLVGDGVSFSDAKAQAQDEILASFNISESIERAETLSISASGVPNAVLLAVSIVVQGDRSEAELTELLSRMSSDIRDNGAITDEQTLGALRDSAMGLNLRAIRSNVETRYEALGRTVNVPPFEAFVDSTGDGRLNSEDLSVTGLLPEDGTHVRSATPTLRWPERVNDFEKVVVRV